MIFFYFAKQNQTRIYKTFRPILSTATAGVFNHLKGLNRDIVLLLSIDVSGKASEMKGEISSGLTTLWSGEYDFLFPFA